LRGQLTSAYQYKDGINSQQNGFAQISNEQVTSTYQRRLVSLPEILNKYGYKTYFLASTDRNSTLNTMLKSMPFTHVYGMGDFDGYQDDRMTDKQTFTALKALLSEQQHQPFFIGVYPSGTHHGRDSPDLKYKDGKNPYYNKFYNYDAQLGDFIKYFDKSEFSENTLLIITADHSTYPTPEFKNSFGINANYFVDKIPLIVHSADTIPQKIDAHSYNSLSLAPTILQLINVNNEPNYFLGCSLFDEYCRSQFSNMSAVGDSYYKTSSGVYPEYNVTELPESPSIKEFYNISG
jgi:phosphoglycerol transferase MdoB-like AlkP superfamily enzyme